MTLLEAARDYLAPLQDTLSRGPVLHGGMPPAQARAIVGDCVLRPLLPQRYAVSAGSVFSQDSAQASLDGLLIHDATYQLALGGRHPVELVYAMVDVSAMLDLNDLDARLATIEGFKRLRRDKSTAYDVTPVHHLRMFGARYAQLSDDQLNPPLGYILADDADEPQALYERLNSALKTDQLRAEFSPDAIFGLKGGWLIARQTRTGELAVPRSSFGKFGLYRPGSDLLIWIYFLLNVSLSQIQLRAPDLLRTLAALSKH